MPEKVKELDTLLVNQLQAGEAKLPKKNPDFAAKSSKKSSNK
jgi:hypothetical protein